MGRHSASSGGPRAPRRAPGRLVWIVLLVALGVLILDQVSKFLAVQSLSEGQRISLVGDWLTLYLVYNPGAAFSFASGATWIFTIIAVVVIVVVIRVSRSLGSVWWSLCLGLLLGGAGGNLIDRLVREPSFGQGHVVDFIAYGNLFVGNVADIAIVLAALGVAVLAVLGIEVDGSRPSSDGDGTEDAAGHGEGVRRQSILPENE